jgi:hypothetical protein
MDTHANRGDRIMKNSKEAFVAALLKSFASAKQFDKPYKYWLLENCLPADAVEQILRLPFPAPSLGGLSGRREVHNATRRYFDQKNMETFAVCKSFNEAFQDRRATEAIEAKFATKLAGTFLRVEFAQDTDGFWLEPHTDLGVKVFTMLLYLSQHPDHAELGTDIYGADKMHVGRSPFVSNGAMVFVPSNITYHGFEPRKIDGIRQSVIINYVTNEWRAREQLAFPNAPIA